MIANRISLFALLAVLALLATGCPAAQEPGLTVAAAANVNFAFDELGTRFTEQSGIPLTFVFGSTGTLAQQIENGAPFDVFAAADEITIDRLAAQSLTLDGSRRTYAQGRLVIVVNRASGLTVVSLADLADPAITRIAIANPEHAPYGQAAREALSATGLWDTLQDRIVWAETVRQALQFVQTGDAAAGLVALSIADVPEVATTSVPDDLYQPINQAMAVLSRTTRPDAARQFLDFVTGSEGQAILKRYGYRVPGEF